MGSDVCQRNNFHFTVMELDDSEATTIWNLIRKLYYNNRVSVYLQTHSSLVGGFTCACCSSVSSILNCLTQFFIRGQGITLVSILNCLIQHSDTEGTGGAAHSVHCSLQVLISNHIASSTSAVSGVGPTTIVIRHIIQIHHGTDWPLLGHLLS